MRIVIKVEYDGTNYCGWQIQPNGDTVQKQLEKAIEKITGERSAVIGSGRTDSGVHALGQVAHFDTSSSVLPENFYRALNSVLPKDIKVISSAAADENFHARFSAKKKTYIYRMYQSEFPHPLKSRYAAHIPYTLDVEEMKKACRYLLGKHDFKCFLSANSSVKDTVREIYHSELNVSGEDITYTVTGNGFLYNMVRIIVGTLVKIGEGKMTAEDMKKVIDSGDRSLAGITMPPCGLTLLKVEY